MCVPWSTSLAFVDHDSYPQKLSVIEQASQNKVTRNEDCFASHMYKVLWGQKKWDN